MRARVLGALLVAYVLATVGHIAYVVAHEPFSFDAWNVAVDTRAKPITVGRFFEYWRYEYAHSNPRLGQPLTYLTYKLSGFAEVATPLAYLALTLAITVIGLGRWPRRARELAIWAMVIGFGWFALPQIGRNMFCRAYAANYVYGAAIQLWLVAAFRVTLARAERASRDQIASFAMAGALAGICNEHTGPALVVFFAGYAWWQRRRGADARVSLAAAIGTLVGFCALFFAPGQDERYGGLAQRRTFVEQVLDRGVSGCLEIVRDYIVYAAPVLALIVLVLLYMRVSGPAAARERSAGRFVLIALAAGLLVGLTVCVSPKLGSRFFIAPLALLLAGLVAVVDLARARVLAVLVAFAVIVSVYAAVRTVPLYRTVNAQSAARLAALEATAPGSTIVVEPFTQVRESWWFIGDDFRDGKKCAMVARYFDLAKVTLRDTRRSRR